MAPSRLDSTVGSNSAVFDKMEQRGNSPVLVMHDGVTKSILVHLNPAEGVDYPCCEKVVKMIGKDLDTLGYHRVLFRSDNEPFILSVRRAVKLVTHCKKRPLKATRNPTVLQKVQ